MELGPLSPNEDTNDTTTEETEAETNMDKMEQDTNMDKTEPDKTHPTVSEELSDTGNNNTLVQENKMAEMLEEQITGLN
eukprot:11320092-Ditylum_brightwellii.AAC.1